MYYSPAVEKRIVDRKESLNLSKSLFVALARRTNRTCGTDGADRSRTCDWFKLSFLKRSTLLKRNHMNRPITCTAFHSLFFCQLSFRGKREAIQSLEFVSRGPHFSDRLHLLHQQGGSELHLYGALFVLDTFTVLFNALTCRIR